VLRKLRAGSKKYKNVKIFLIDWDTYKGHPVTTGRKIPRRSTLVLLKNGRETARLVAATGEGQLKGILEKALK